MKLDDFELPVRIDGSTGDVFIYVSYGNDEEYEHYTGIVLMEWLYMSKSKQEAEILEAIQECKKDYK